MSLRCQRQRHRHHPPTRKRIWKEMMEVVQVPRNMSVIDRSTRGPGEVRCPRCNKLLGKEIARGKYSMEFKCPRCGEISTFFRKR
ncbi:MAG: Com family DNA-binding transcriptional regulator [Prevotella sp.]